MNLNIKSYPRKFFQYGLSVLKSIEQKKPYINNIPLRPVFILGAPRSGTTLTYQIIAQHMDVSYFSNLHEKFYTNPSFIEKIFTFIAKPKNNYTSKHGRSHGLSAPSEAGKYWYRFFSKSPQYITLDTIDDKKMRQMQISLQQFQQARQKPIVIKNLVNVVRLDAFLKYIPDALFIIVHRDFEDNIHSILNARQKSLNAINKWWSVEIPNAKKIEETKSGEKQVFEQITQIHQIINDTRDKFGKTRFYDLKYDDLCNAPHQELEKINAFLDSHSLKTKLNTASLTKTFEIKKSTPLSDTIATNVKNLLNNTE